MSVPAQTIIDNLHWRYATKKFDPSRKVSEVDIRTIIQSGILAPSSFGLQPWSFVIVKDPLVRQKLVALSWNQTQIVDASHLIVIARKTSMTSADVEKFVQSIVTARGLPSAAPLEQYKNMMLGFVNNPAPGFDVNAWTSRQCYIALGFMMHTAAQMRIDACPMEGFNPGGYDEVLGLSRRGLGATVVLPVGYRAADDAHAAYKKVRYSAEELVVQI